MSILKIEMDVSDDLLGKIKLITEQSGIDINSLVNNYLSHLAESGLHKDYAMNGNLWTLFNYSMGKVTRSEAKAALGLGADDMRLTTMMRMAAFSPPRATIEVEDAELEAIKDLHFE